MIRVAFLTLVLVNFQRSACQGDELMLIQHPATLSLLRRSIGSDDDHDEKLGCANLANQGMGMYTIDVDVGSPKQTVSMIIDTGSDSLIVPSCYCKAHRHGCNGTRCYDADKSETFKEHADQTPVMVNFAAGGVRARRVVDKVSVGGVAVTMQSGLLDMTDKSFEYKTDKYEFEGVIGFGLPKKDRADMFFGPTELEAAERLGFLEEAQVQHFSMCLHDDNTGGMLQLGGPTIDASHQVIDHQHWTLDLRGVSVAGREVNTVSNGRGLHADAAIIDSGMPKHAMPMHDYRLMLESMCDGWDRCKSNFTASRVAKWKWWTSHRQRKWLLVEKLLQDCGDWMTPEMKDSKLGLDELPPIFLQVGGMESHSQMLELPKPHAAWNEEYEQCELFMYPADRPQWVLGAQLFKGYTIGFDLRKHPPSMSFVSKLEKPCGKCDQ
jgi:hypothetical protein